MASRGKHVQGTDGSDFVHRETVATRYEASAKGKIRMRFVIFAQYFVQLIAALILLNVQSNSKLPTGELPMPIWFYVWMASSLPGAAGYLALQKNSLTLIIFYIWGTIFLGICPLASGLFVLISTNAADAPEFFILNHIPLLYAELALCIFSLPIQLYGFYNAKILRDSWIPKYKPQ